MLNKIDTFLKKNQYFSYSKRVEDDSTKKHGRKKEKT